MKPLTKKQRYISVSILGFFFILIAPIIVLYSLGYTFDNGFKIQKTGGVFVHSDLSNTSVFVNGNFSKSAGIFARNILIQDLVPNKKYLIEVKKEGYQNWTKEVYVYPSIVSEGSVLMLPEIIEKREILKYIDKSKEATSTPSIKGQKPNNPEYIEFNSLFTATGTTELSKKIITETSSTTSSKKQKSEIELFFETLKIDTYTKLPNLIINGKEVSWLANGNIELYWIDDTTNIPFYYCGGEDERVCTTRIELNWEDQIKRFDYLPGRTDVWIVLTTHGIFAVEVDGRTTRNIQTIYKGQNIDFRLTPTDTLIIKEGTSFFEIVL